MNNDNSVRQFSDLLKTVDVNEVSPDRYCRDYLRHLITYRSYYLSIYQQLFQVLAKNSTTPKKLSIIDFGCGNGLLGLFASYCGYGNVILLDADPVFLESARMLAARLGIHAEFIHGDEKALKSISGVDVVLGTDVIEHVYDLHELLSILKDMNPAIITLFTTASNPENYFKVHKLKRLQRHDEFKGYLPGESQLKDHSSHPSFREMRRRIIKEENNTLTEFELGELVTNTRGMNKPAIVSAVQNYLKTKVFPGKPMHTTNTCNPETGSWTERILTIEEYFYLYNSKGFHLDLYAGFYNESLHGFRGLVNKIRNRLVKMTGLVFAPYILLAGTESRKVNQ